MRRAKFILFAALGIFGCTTKNSTIDQSQRIVFFGDSITELGDAPGGYVSIVRDSLRSIGLNIEVIGAGISGNKVTDLKQRLHKDVLEKKPGIVVIYIGINDVWHFQFKERGLTGTPKETYAQLLSEIVTGIQKNGSIVVLATPSVIGEKNDGTNRWDPMLDEYSEISRTVAMSHGATLLDLRKTFIEFLKSNNPANAEKEILTTDGVHLNMAGNRLVAEEMFRTFDGLGLFFPKK